MPKAAGKVMLAVVPAAEVRRLFTAPTKQVVMFVVILASLETLLRGSCGDFY